MEAIILANVRTPSERLGDLRAQVAANRRAAQRMAGLARKYGTDELLRIMDAVLDYSEAMMRRALLALPDGEASFTDVVDGDGVLEPGETDDATFRVKLRITQAGRHHHRRLRRLRRAGGRADERAAERHRLRRVRRAEDDRRSAEPDPAQLRLLAAGAGHGAARAVVNAQEPAPVVYANHEMSHRVAEMTFAAMHRIAPDR